MRRLLALTTYAPQLTDNVNNVLRSFMTVETNMVSVERLFQYVDLIAEEKVPPHHFGDGRVC